MDRGYDTGAVHRGLELLGITGYIPAIRFPNDPSKYGFSYDPQQDTFICPMGQPLVYHRLNCNKSTGKYLRCYQVQGDVCRKCTSRKTCFDTAGVRRRILASSCYPAFYRGHLRVNTPEYLYMMRKRKIWAEGSFAVMKREHNFLKIRKRGILAATEECLLSAMALNLKRYTRQILTFPGQKKEAAAGHGQTRSAKIFLPFGRSHPQKPSKKPPAVPGIARQAAWFRPCFKDSFTLSGSVPGTRIF